MPHRATTWLCMIDASRGPVVISSFLALSHRAAGCFGMLVTFITRRGKDGADHRGVQVGGRNAGQPDLGICLTSLGLTNRA